MMHVASSVLMVRPVSFRMNEQTAVNNYYQQKITTLSEKEILNKVLKEFDDFALKLKNSGVEVMILQDDLEYDTPDSIFPNNWISLHPNGNLVTYPMFAKNRRKERCLHRVKEILNAHDFKIQKTISYTHYEDECLYLEGTGSIILDYTHKKAYCGLSPRANAALFEKFCRENDYKPIAFTANQTVNGERKAIYHTNVMMAITSDFVIICLSSIDNEEEKATVVKEIKTSGKELIEITETQVHQFAGNMLQLTNSKGDFLMVMSTSAYKSLTPDQESKIKKSCTILHSSLATIETCGGGSARCMLAEIFLPKKDS